MALGQGRSVLQRDAERKNSDRGEQARDQQGHAGDTTGAASQADTEHSRG
jgi:hypothetical protein